MGSFGLPKQFVNFNTLQTKNPVVVVKIAGINDLFTNSQLLTQILYGDPGVVYGASGLVYGGLKAYLKKLPDGSFATFRDYLELQASNPSIQQRLEPEQGRASVSTLSLSFVDVDGYMTQVVSPGVLIPEILGTEVEVFLGYQQTSYPLDFFRLFRGYITSVEDTPGLVKIQISDPNLKMRQVLFYIAQTAAASAIGPSDTIIPVQSNSNFFDQIIGPDYSTYNKSIHTYIQVEDEWIEAIPLFQGQSGYSVFIQGITYVAQPGFSNNVSIQYISGGTAGSELVTVLSDAITVQLQVGVSTALQVAQAITQSPLSNVLVTAQLNPPNMLLAQSAQAQTYLAQTTHANLVVQGMLYTAAPGHSSDVSITYANDGTAGSETVTVVGAAITVHIQSSASTNQGILTALLNAYPLTTPLITWKTLPTKETTIVSGFSTTNLIIGLSGSQFAVISRGARGTTASAHDIGSAVAAGLQVGDSAFQENAIDMALKIMMSGWNAPWITGVPIDSIGPEPDLSPFITQTDFIQLPAGVDAVSDYGLVAGDYIILNGSAAFENNNRYAKIVRFDSFLGDSNRLIYIQSDPATNFLTKEQNTPATIGFRSQYDVYPVDAGLKLTPKDVDIASHLYVKQTFLGTAGNDLIFFITSQEDSGKDFISSQIMLPIGAYSLTKRGKIACNYHSPPIANQSIVTISADSVIEPNSVSVSRALNNRAFYNEIDITYNYDDSGNPLSNTAIIDSPSYELIGVNTALPIDAKGVYSGYSAQLLQKRAFFLLQRYKRGAVMVKLSVNWEVGCTCEAGDIALVQDNKGILQISNFNSGVRGLGQQLFEVIDRTFNIKQGNVSLQLVGNIGASISDRFAVISPSSFVNSGSTTTRVIIQDSFGALFPGNESQKWVNYINQEILVHSRDYSVSSTTTLLGVDPSNNYALLVSALPFTPVAGYVVDIPNYPASTDPTVNQYEKLVHCFLDPTVTVVTGIDSHNFTVSGGDIGKFHVNCPVRLHSKSFSQDSGDLAVSAIVGNQITTSTPIGFTPSASTLVDLIGFDDFDATLNTGNPYRYI